ncbi:MAG: hypothetical protein O7D91_04555 [Planctomycetota bacterium]|nr:hypothetical protein [Planctomycetota bacterium]
MPPETGQEASILKLARRKGVTVEELLLNIVAQALGVGSESGGGDEGEGSAAQPAQPATDISQLIRGALTARETEP